MGPTPYMYGLIATALAAGRAILAVYAKPIETQTKRDSSPVTAADFASERIILEGLAEHDSTTPVISEEAAAEEEIPACGNRFYLVDPLDGTKEFLSRNGEFTVNIALVENGEPVAGVVYAPALGRLFCGERGNGAWQADVSADMPADRIAPRRLSVRQCPADGATVVASRSHRDIATDEWLKSQRVAAVVSAGSALKFCLLATGEADLYPRIGRTMEWDTAAGHAVLAAAGGRVETLDGAPLVYGKKERGFDNPSFIARGG